MRVESLADQLYFVTAQLVARRGSDEWLGTAFLYKVEVTGGGHGLFLITNRHMLEHADELEVRMIGSGPDNLPRLGVPATATFKPLTSNRWAAHPDNNIDVAAISFYQVLEAMDARGICPFFKSIDPSLCLTPAIAHELDSVEEITFVGYPSGLYDDSSCLPIVRRGITATPLSVDYQGKPSFLVDAAVFPGSSGSPVFIVNKGSYQTRETFVVGQTRLICLGLVAAVHLHPVTGTLAQMPTALSAVTEIPSGLGIVYKAATFNECVDILLHASGVARKPE
jgi:hypothetical protein